MSDIESEVAGQIEWFAADWGTSQLRVWGVSSTGEIVFQTNSNKGAGFLKQGEFESSLLNLISQQILDKSEIPVVICGMAGSRQGWKEAQYVKMPTKISQVFQSVITVKTEDSRLKVYILPGLCQQDIDNPDVIRGEETQLIGLIDSTKDFSGIVCMPGTHSKWVEIEDGTICSSRTYFTGELFSLLCNHSMLRHSIEYVKSDKNSGFFEGVERAFKESTSAFSDIFSIRARQLLFDSTKAWSYSFLSGLLIGHEIKHGISQEKVRQVTIIGETSLVENYSTAFAQIGIETNTKSVELLTLIGLQSAYDFLH